MATTNGQIDRSLTEQDTLDFDIPFHLLDSHLCDDEDTEQHKAHRGQNVRKRSIDTRVRDGQQHSKTSTPSTCGLGLLINGPFPYRGYWQVTIATILYVTELVLFFFFAAIMLARWIMYPHVAVRRVMSDPDELGAYAIPLIALMTMAALTATQVSSGP
ncbi:unnamed protein product [Zymoseptoria tritici ST99CH_1A5]|uniref:Uncharacterized protein n=3 Tax=Zymoseptoria tritici TaxID=1047171 RepID=A0A1X7RTY6_ZYMT9|nr:unnamed protein product [Zymoseptoria tritici ST99CH_3D7]SMR52783.1 unnamed protein product [Zymoseptoria tritici ST99CH_1E4]SMR54115.1 unnamed protein product [Zymoseptoria tritici ST99CH_3D1]SMY24534.1 unnamed protein product [Zymoseptoria tritici ST99CH_1A5]